MALHKAVALLLIAVLLPTVAGAAEEMDWYGQVARICPGRHIDWIGGGAYDDILGDFERTLPEVTQSKIHDIADYARRCAREDMGFECEMRVHLDAIRRLGLLRRFSVFTCSHYRCDAIGHCYRGRKRAEPF